MTPPLAPTLDKALAALATLGPLPTDITVALDAAYHSDTTPRGRSNHQVAGGAHLCLGNQFGELRWCTERNTPVVGVWISLAHAINTLGRLIRQAWTCYRW
jgi:hypothetical protein